MCEIVIIDIITIIIIIIPLSSYFYSYLVHSPSFFLFADSLIVSCYQAQSVQPPTWNLIFLLSFIPYMCPGCLAEFVVKLLGKWLVPNSTPLPCSPSHVPKYNMIRGQADGRCVLAKGDLFPRDLGVSVPLLAREWGAECTYFSRLSVFVPHDVWA